MFGSPLEEVLFKMMNKCLALCIFASLLGIGNSSAWNSTYCCSHPNEVIKRENPEQDRDYYCFEKTANVRTKIKLNCSEDLHTSMDEDNIDFELKVGPDKQLLFMLGEEEFISIHRSQFCLGNRLINGTTNVSLVLLCRDPAEPEVVSEEALGICMGLSSVFLALTALVYICLPELRDLHGKSIISLCTSLAMANMILCVMKVTTYERVDEWCAFRGFIAYHFLVTSFFWMNAIAVQVLRSIKSASMYHKGREFLWYSLYAWGIPIVCTIILITLNYHPGNHLKPGIGHQHCWFLDMRRTWIFMYSIMSILMAANVLIFIYASAYLWRHTFASSHVRAVKYKFSMMLRLFILMGLPWIFEMISTLTESSIVWVVIDVANCLQGILIFIILVVFRRRVIKALHKRNALCCLNNVAEKYLALAGDEEDDIVTHTIAVPLEEK